MQEPQPSPSAAFGAQGGAAASPEALIARHRAEIDQRLEEGLRGIERSATALMREIASEVWRTAGGDKDEIRGTILDDLSHDEAIRSLIAHADERFQSLAVRTGKLEEQIAAISDSIRSTNDRLAQGVAVLAKLGAGGGGSEEASALRQQLAVVTRQVAAALQTLGERDQAIVETVRTRIREHGELITQETTRISKAMEAYVQHGVQAVGQLAGSVETQIATIAERDRELEERVLGAIGEQMRQLAEQLQLMYERMAIDTASLSESITSIGQRTEERSRAVGEYLHLLSDRIAVAQRETTTGIGQMVDQRVMGLAHMVRSDSEALRGEIARVAGEQDERIEAAIDRAIAARLDQAVARLESRFEETLMRLDARSDAAAAAMDLRWETAASAMDARLGGLSETLDDRITQLARLIRADNETLAQQIVADQDASKQALRAMKELQAQLPSEVIHLFEQRFASLAESIERSNEMLAKRIDRMGDQMGERQGNDIQVVIDRMGDAMHALASLGRTQETSGPAQAALSDPRIDLE